MDKRVIITIINIISILTGKLDTKVTGATINAECF